MPLEDVGETQHILCAQDHYGYQTLSNNVRMGTTPVFACALRGTSPYLIVTIPSETTFMRSDLLHLFREVHLYYENYITPDEMEEQKQAIKHQEMQLKFRTYDLQQTSLQC